MIEIVQVSLSFLMWCQHGLNKYFISHLIMFPFLWFLAKKPIFHVWFETSKLYLHFIRRLQLEINGDNAVQYFAINFDSCIFLWIFYIKKEFSTRNISKVFFTLVLRSFGSSLECLSYFDIHHFLIKSFKFQQKWVRN